ncbi:hypothetical protein [Scytonema millei]|uniref:Uncharacterized protein n=1 Tax=Scytonema millei VB511283 TaxID=1245923 RepID=A0A9X5I712_9CYAN|nr:hypothetical protein [Scytonema millei]NHC37681.1 hypothetical protein [Scytonema millei VB511283]
MSKDIRVAATSKIWAFATGMLAICIPLSSVTRSGPILPLAAIAGAATGTYFVWRDDNKYKSLTNSDPKQLEQRIANLETIVSDREFELERKIKQLESKD